MLTTATLHILSRTIRETREEFSGWGQGYPDEHLSEAERNASLLALESLARNLADKLGELNPRFDRARFLAACRSAS